ncbi:hypothetical protein Tco_0513714 [Tanacetum coccineum]
MDTRYRTSWILRIGPPRYGVSDLLELAENVLLMVFDQSIIYGVSTDVDTAYSSKSDNGLEFFKVIRYGSTNCNNVLNILRRLVCGVAVYYIWQEKNARIFGNGKKDEKMLCKEIKETIRMMLLSLQVKESKAMKMV